MRPHLLWRALGLAGAALGLLALWHFRSVVSGDKVNVVFFQGDKSVTVATSKTSVGEALKERNIALKSQDVVVPPPSTPLEEGMEIDLGLVERRVRQYKKTTVHAVQVEYADTLNAGEVIDVQAGKDGLEELETETYLLNGQEAFEKVLKSTVLVPAKAAKVIEGTGLRQKLYRLSKRARVWKCLTLEATAYYPGPEDTWPYASGYTASGLKAGYGVAAVDPRLIRLKTPLYVEGYGYALAADKGGAIKGSKIDLCFDTYEEAVRFGRKKIKVYILR